jgi:hypothetical protein
VTAAAALTAWCYPCKALTPMAPGSSARVVNGVALREGRCKPCGGAVYRVGGARGADGVGIEEKRVEVAW